MATFKGKNYEEIKVAAEIDTVYEAKRNETGRLRYYRSYELRVMS